MGLYLLCRQKIKAGARNVEPVDVDDDSFTPLVHGNHGCWIFIIVYEFEILLRFLEDPLSEEIIAGKFKKGGMVNIDAKVDHLVFETSK